MRKRRPAAKSISVREGHDDPHRLANVCLRERGRQSSAGWALAFWRDEWWQWDGRRYRVLPDADLRAEVTQAVKRNFDQWAAAVAAKKRKKGIVGKVTTSLVTNVLQALKGLVLIHASIEQSSWIGRSTGRAPVVSMANGLLDLDRLLAKEPDVLHVHSPDWFSPVHLDYSYNPDAKCPLFDAFLNQIFEGDETRIAFVQEWYGYNLTNDTTQQKFLIGVGEGGNGKKVLADTLTELVDASNVSHVGLESFGERFQLAGTLGKLANIVNELDDIDKVAEGKLKAYVSGDGMYVDRKYLPGVHVRPTARLTFFTNALPKFRDRSEGVWRRANILPFRVEIPEDQQNKHLSDELKTERPGIFNWAVDGLRRLRACQQFTASAVCQQALEAHRGESNSARAFLRECVRARPEATVTVQVLLQQYRVWCANEDHEALDGRQFGKEVARQFPSVARSRMSPCDPTGQRPWRYAGIEYTATAPLVVVPPRQKPRRLESLNLKDEPLPTAGLPLP